MPASVPIPRRTNEPLASRNGGYGAGVLANFLDGVAEVSPRRPVPLDSPLSVGTRLRLRPINADDRDGLAALFGRLSAESRRRRYLGPKRELTPRELGSLTDIDHVHDEAIVAIDERDGSIVGVARYAHVPDRAGLADVAVEVADDLQCLGIGTELARRTVDRARANGLTLLTATTLWENRPARALLRGLGFRTRASHGNEIELELALPTVKAAIASADLPHTKPERFHERERSTARHRLRRRRQPQCQDDQFRNPLSWRQQDTYTRPTTAIESHHTNQGEQQCRLSTSS